MGEYARTYAHMDQLEEQIQELRAKPDKTDYELERLYDLEVELGECRGYIKELEYMDGER